MVDVSYNQLLSNGIGFANTQKWSDAETSLQKAITLEPNNPNAHFQLGNVLRMAGQAEASLTYLVRARDLAPSEAIVHNSLGLSLRAAGRCDEAEKLFLRAIELNENFAEARYNLGRLHGELISYHRAEDIRMDLYGKTILQPDRDIIFSNHSEQLIIANILENLPSLERICVDVGASDGVTFSNSYPLFKSGWGGVAIEPGDKFVDLAYTLKDYAENVSLLRCFATCGNVASILRAYDVPKNFGFLTLDIDSYDYYVTESILKEFRPRLICVEINERIPPPVHFALRPGGKPSLLVSGASICKFESLLNEHKYAIIQLEYNNLFAVPIEDLVHLQTQYKALSGQDAWLQGYWNRPDRNIRFPWNKSLEPLAGNSADEIVRQLRTFMQDQLSFIDLNPNGQPTITQPNPTLTHDIIHTEANALLVVAKKLYVVGHFQEALPLCQAAARMAPNYSTAYHCLGATLNKLARKEEAYAALQQALVLSSKISRARVPAWPESSAGQKILDIGFDIFLESAEFPSIF